MKLRPGHRFETAQNWAIFEVISISDSHVSLKQGPALSDEEWDALTDHIHVMISHDELQRLLDSRMIAFDDPEFDWDDPEPVGQPNSYPLLDFLSSPTTH
jgi:hypothetical protein